MDCSQQQFSLLLVLLNGDDGVSAERREIRCSLLALRLLKKDDRKIDWV